MISPDRMMSMYAAIELKCTLEQAIARGVVKTAEELAAWPKLQAEVRAIHRKGQRVDLLVEPIS